MFHLFGKLPLRGEEVSSGGLIFKVERMGKARILRVRVTKGLKGKMEGNLFSLLLILIFLLLEGLFAGSEIAFVASDVNRIAQRPSPGSAFGPSYFLGLLHNANRFSQQPLLDRYMHYFKYYSDFLSV